MDTTISIVVHPTYFTLPVDMDGNVSPMFNIRSVIYHLKETQYDYQLQRSVVLAKYYAYSHAEQRMYLPRHFLPVLVDFLKGRSIPFQIEIGQPVPTRLINIPLNHTWQPRDNQDQAIAWLLDRSKPLRCLSIQTGCLTGDTYIAIRQQKRTSVIPLATLYRHWNPAIPTEVRSFKHETIGYHIAEDVIFSGVKPVVRVTLANELSLKCTLDHLLLTHTGWVPAYCTTGKYVVCDHHLHRLSPVVKVEELGEEPTYDIQCQAPHHNFVANGMVVHNSGKTFCAIQAIAQLQHPAIILASGLVEQWRDEVLEKTHLTPDEVYVLQGFKSIKSLFDKPDYHPKVFVGSLDTIQEFAGGISENYRSIPSFTDFLTRHQIGTKATDEFHLNFLANTMIDLRSNVANNLYLSATPKRSSRRGQEIFQIVFPRDIRFGEEFYSKYASVTFYRYNLNIQNPNRLCTPKGYSHNKYESQLLQPRPLQDFVTRVIFPLIQTHFIFKRKPEQKMLIFVQTVRMCESLLKYVAWQYPELRVLPYLGPDPESNLKEGEIIISTPKSCGTGKDLKNLLTVLNTCSFSSEPLIEQMLGRLRRLPNGDVPEFLDVYNGNITHHIRHMRNRSRILRELALYYQELVI